MIEHIGRVAIISILLGAAACHAATPASQPDLRGVGFAYDREFAEIETFATAATPARPTDPIAKVNGEPVSRERLTELLYEAHGRRMLQALLALEIVKQRARERKVTVTQADIDNEQTRYMPEEILRLEPQERERVLDDYLDRHGLTRVELRLAIERNAYLRKLLADMPEPAEKDLRELFNRMHGEKVRVRHIQVRTFDRMAEVNRRLNRGEKFEDVARDLSENKATAANGGLLEPFDRNEPRIPKEVREVAFDGLSSIGDVSGDINADGFIHKISLDERVPPAKVKFEDERPKLAALVRERMIRLQMNFELSTMVPAAEIEILDPILKQQWHQPASQTGPER